MILTGRTALVTGAARRLGRAVAEDLARAGARVAVHYHRSATDAAAVVDAIRAHGGTAESFRADLADAAAVTRLAAEVEAALGPVDVLVNNASVFYATPLATLDLAAWRAMLAVNLEAPYVLGLALGRAMRARGAGKIVNLTDATADPPAPDYLPYGVSKAALGSLTRGLARALAPHVQVNAVAPGPVLEPIDGSSMDAVLRRTPLGRVGDPADVVAAVRFLLEGTDFVTGTTIVVDGGRALG